MPRTTKPLTNTEIKQAKPKDKEYNLVDGDGLSLRVNPKGSKFWLFNYYRPITKKRANISFGSYPALSLAQARELRKKSKELLAQNIDEKHELRTLESIERIEFAVTQFKEAVRKLEPHVPAFELELIIQPLLTIDDANKHLVEVILKPANQF